MLDLSSNVQYYKSQIIKIYFNLSCNNEMVFEDLSFLLRELKLKILRRHGEIRQDPNQGKQGPNQGKQGPNQGKQGPNQGKHMNDSIECLRLLYLLIGHTRDGALYSGRGQRDLSYKMIYIWYQFFPVLAIFMVHRLFDTFGSFKDMKRFCKCISEYSIRGEDDPLIDIAIRIVNHSLHSGSYNISYHLPREHGSSIWLYKKCAKDWARTYIPYLENCGSLTCKKYRKTIQKNGLVDMSAVVPIMNNEKFIGTFIRNAEKVIQKYHNNNNSEEIKNVCFLDIQLLNIKWVSFMNSVRFYYNTKNIPIIDVSSECDDDAYYTGIGFGLLLAMTGSQRILISSHKPIWVDLSDSTSFYDAFCKVLNSFQGMRTSCDWRGSQYLLNQSLKTSRILEKGIHLQFILFSGIWRPLTQGFSIPIIYWNTGSTQNMVDTCLQDNSGIFMSGENIRMFSAFLELLNNKNNRIVSSFDVIFYFLENSQYKCLGNYFDMFCYRLME